MTSANDRPPGRTGAILREVAEPTNPLSAGTRVGPYVIVATLGQGGYGVTYRARDPQRHQDVAIKEFLPTTVARRQAHRVVTPLSEHTAELLQWGRAQFLAEASKLTGLARVPVIAVRDAFEDNGTAYMVMDLVHGESLEARLRRDRRLPRQTLERLLYPLIEGLQVVHEAGLVHADIKPAHILVDGAGRPTLIDFGAARLALADRVRLATGAVTSGYAAPEQVSAARCGTWTDIYGLSGTLYHSVSGIVPLGAAERMGRDVLVPAADIARGRYARSLLSAIDAGLKPDIGDRPQTITAWRRILDAEAPEVKRAEASAPNVAPIARHPARRIVVERRHRAASAAAIVGALVAVGFGVAPLLGPMGQAPEQTRHRTLADVQASGAPASQPGQLAQARQPTAAEAMRRAEEERKAAEAERQRLAIAEARRRADEEVARQVAELERQRAAAAEARRQVEEETARRAAAEKAATEKAAAEKAATDRAAAEAARQAEEQARLQAEAQRKAQAEAAARAATEAAREAEERARLKAEMERYAEAEAKAIAAAQAAREKAEVEARARSDSETRRRTAELIQRAADEAARQEAESWPKAEAEARRLTEAAETALQLGEAERKRVQAALSALGYEVGATTGAFGPRTRTMIRAWQKQQGLPETGYITGLQLTALHLKAAPILAKTEPPQARQDAETRRAEADPRRAEADEAALGLSEADRKRAQAGLTVLGHEIGATTGFFGPRTRAMIAAWQKKQGLPETGYLNAAQWTELQQQAATAAGKRDEPQHAGGDKPRPEVDPRQAEAEEAALRLSEADRKRAQIALTSLGHEIGAATGYFGPRTRAMITAWQKKQGLPETGFLTAAQWTSLQQQAAPVLAKYEGEQRRLEGDQPKADLDRRQAEAEEATLGLSEPDRKRVQFALTSLGHEIGATTGYFGPRTRAMIASWQKAQGLPETGFLTAAQWVALRRQAAPALARYDPEVR